MNRAGLEEADIGPTAQLSLIVRICWLYVIAALRPQSGEIVKTGDMSLVDQLEAGGYAVLSEAEH